MGQGIKTNKILRKIKNNRMLSRILWIFVFLAVWEVSVKLLQVSPMLFPSVEEVLHTLLLDMKEGNLFFQTLMSLGIILIGMLIAMIVSLILAVLAEQSVVINGMVDTLTVLAHPLPGLALLPLIIMWFGTGTGAVLTIIIHSALWPMLLNLQTGFHSVPSVYKEIGRNLGMSGWQLTYLVKLPASGVYLLAGTKIGWARAWRAFISAEMVFGAVGKNGGIGWYIFKQRTFMNTPGLFAGIVLVILLGILVEDLLFSVLEKHVMVWE